MLERKRKCGGRGKRKESGKGREAKKQGLNIKQ
jgi:hypothetical protein